MFRILVVDDDETAACLLQEVMKNLQRPHELHFVKDGVEALDFLHCRAGYQNAPRPNLILLDVNMPRLNGIETLAAIKYDPELYVIPVIMLSSGGIPEDVRRSYEAHANCYVQKPTDLERSLKLVQAVEAFWMDFALLPSGLRPPVRDRLDMDASGPEAQQHRSSGPTIARVFADEKRVMTGDTVRREQRTSGCNEHNSLLDSFGGAVRELLTLHEAQFLAIVEGDTECNRFDILIHMANEKKQLAKYAYIRHVESHGCANLLS